MYIENNFYNEQIVKKANEIISKYLERMCDARNKNYAEYDCIVNLMVICDLFPYIENQGMCLEIIYDFLKKLNVQIDKKYLGIGVFDGTTGLAWLTHWIYTKTRNFRKMNSDMNAHLIHKADTFLTYCQNNIENVSVRHFDAISGLSGVSYYLAELNPVDVKNTIDKIISYFSSLSEEYEFNGSILPKWHVKHINLDHAGRDKYPEGNLNFGLSHGIPGILASLCKLYKAKYSQDKIRGLISYYYTTLIRFMVVSEQLTYWPSYASPEVYVRGATKPDEIHVSPSWCYGNWSTCNIMKTAAAILDDDLNKDLFAKSLEALCQTEVYFPSPIICHGYAGNLAMLTRFFNNDKRFKKAIEEMAKKVFSFYDPTHSDLFRELEMSDSILTGSGGVILGLISMLKGMSTLNDVLMLL